jgi:hypothetical protein
MHIGFQQRHTNLPHGIIDIRLRKPSVPAQVGKNIRQSFCQILKHNNRSVSSSQTVNL